MTTFTTEDRQNASPPHIVDSGASVKTLADYIEQETREEMLRNQMHLLHERVKELEIENVKLKREIENLNKPYQMTIYLEFKKPIQAISNSIK